MNILKSTGVIFAGLVVIFVLSYATDFVLKSLGILPYDNLFVGTGLILFVIFYRILYSVIGCYIAARMAPHHPMRHALILGGIGFIFSILGLIANAQMNLGPAWYAWSFVILAFPAAWLGGWFYVRSLTADSTFTPR